MRSFLENFGLLAIFFVIVYGYKKIVESYDLKRMALHENKKVYQAADAFVHGAKAEEVESILENCFELEKGDAAQIVSQAMPHRMDKDRGYRVFIRSVNRVVGDELYDERYPHIEK